MLPAWRGEEQNRGMMFLACVDLQPVEEMIQVHERQPFIRGTYVNPERAVQVAFVLTKRRQ